MSTEAGLQPGWRALLRGEHLPRLAVLCLGIWLHASSSMLAATTLPRAVQEIGGAHLVGWAFTLFMLGSILAGAATGVFVARFGLRRALQVGGSLYGIGCVVCALAPDMVVLLSGRLFQGVGGGSVLALVYVASGRLFPDSLVPRLMALISAVWSTSAFCGPLIGGGFATLGVWRLAFWTFALQTVVFVIAVAFVFRNVEDELADGPAFRPRRLSILAIAILLVAIAGAQVHPIMSPSLCIVSVVLLWIFLKLDGADPSSRMFPSRPTDLGHPVGAGLLLIFTASIATMSFLVYGPFLLDLLYGVTPLTAGYIIVLESVGWGVAAIVFSGTPESAERWLIRGGTAIVTAAILGFALLMPGGPLWAVVALALCQGAGFGTMWGFIIRRVVAAAPAAERDQASSSLPTTQQTGFAIGAAASGIVANMAGFADGLTSAAATSVGFWVFAAFLPLALFANVAAWRMHTGRTTASA